jgi:integrase
MDLRHLFPGHLRAAATDPPVDVTDVEAADCRGVPEWLQDTLGSPASLDHHAAMFDAQVLPAIQAKRTRATYFANWRAFITYAHIHDCIDQAVPATPAIIKGYLWFLLQSGYRPGTITIRLYSIIDRHLRFRLPFPYHQKEIKAWTKAFERLCGVPRRDKLAITSTHLKAVLSTPRSTLRDIRDITIVALGTVCALRVSELIELDVCDLLFDFEPNTMAVRVKKRKNDQKRAGLWPRVGRASCPRYDIISLCLTWLARSGLHVRESCEKARHPRSACRTCGRLFTRLMGCGTCIFPVGHKMHGASPNTIQDAVSTRLELAGFPASEFSGISMRRGGLTTAISDGVPSSLYELQSGHTSDAWKHYVRPGQTDQLLRFFQAFKL